ncbi:branched-chain amino acid ABC transporter permease [Actinomadura sp. WMMB 499]|uniref:branched-chain amino acid ABC transporter permease n=1 Tax=Actinomadura sp. WMMB 499 TaxID=1219491 RepID=UPI0012471AAB|nr:branched-chain amino acid ABC transporter permease [Actinomadura sp. WMMB 499]QFG22171.1 branched-chain amino acid ABC transporter permease [Actinomadura sp. WMMB 499]
MTGLLTALVNGMAVGSGYALVALGFVIIYKATGLLNFAQGTLLLLGAYLTYTFHVVLGIAFYPAVLLAMLCGAAVGALLERLVLRHLVGQPLFTQVMVTVGLLFVLTEVCAAFWGVDALDLRDPWGLGTASIGGVVISDAYLWRMGLAALVLVLFFLFFRYSATGLAMRATAIDQEAARAQGISTGKVHLLAWSISGAVAAVGGVMLSAGPGGLAPHVQFVALLAFPAMILGGLDSPAGAVVGGLLIGISQSLAGRYFGDWFPWLGSGFDQVFPYVLMIAILLARPYGLWGTREVRRA